MSNTLQRELEKLASKFIGHKFNYNSESGKFEIALEELIALCNERLESKNRRHIIKPRIDENNVNLMSSFKSVHKIKTKNELFKWSQEKPQKYKILLRIKEEVKIRSGLKPPLKFREAIKLFQVDEAGIRRHLNTLINDGFLLQDGTILSIDSKIDKFLEELINV